MSRIRLPWAEWTALVVICLSLWWAGLEWTRPAVTVDSLGFVHHFSMSDPVGDDHGPGSYTYPTHEAFAGEGLLDLTHFAVKSDANWVYFDLTFVEITNPWRAPEGFFHPLIQIYMDTVPGYGQTSTYTPGAQVQFSSEYPWDILVQAKPWGQSQLVRIDSTGKKTVERGGLRAMRLAETQTVRIQVAREWLKLPEDHWAYYVLIGAYDGFGTDHYRAVQEQGDDWIFGGGDPSGVHPYVIDLLAPTLWGRTQEAQLSSFHPESGQLATLDPVGVELQRRQRGVLLMVVLAVLILGSGGGWLAWKKWRKPKE